MSDLNPEPSNAAIDWDAAAWWAGVLTPAGPATTRSQAGAVVDSLRTSAAQAPPLVAGITGLHDAAETAATFPRLVIDRPTWARANIDVFASITAGKLPAPTNAAMALTAGLEVGGLLGAMSSRVLGQFDPFSSRLLLVAPNIVATRRRLGVDETDFGLWVALHELTHAVQFAAAPWLADYLRAAMGVLVESISADPAERPKRLARNLPRAWGQRGASPLSSPFLEASLTAAESAELAKVVAVMSMLEGHADVVMDSAEISSVRAIRSRFNHRREEPRLGERLLRWVLGLDAKLAQYRVGAEFVRGVIGAVGHEGFNAVFAGPGALPTPAEIVAPARWVERVGAGAGGGTPAGGH